MAACGKCPRCKEIGKIVSSTRDALPPSSLTELLSMPCPAQTTRPASTPGSDSWNGANPSLVQPDEPAQPIAPAAQSDTAREDRPTDEQPTLSQVNRTSAAEFPLAFSPPLPPLEVRDLPSPPPLDEDSDDEDSFPVLTQIMSQIKHPSTHNLSRKVKDKAARKRDKEKHACTHHEEVKVKDEPEEDHDDMYLDYPEDSVVPPGLIGQSNSAPLPTAHSHPGQVHRKAPSDGEGEELDEIHDDVLQPKISSKKKRKLSPGGEQTAEPALAKRVKREPEASPDIGVPPQSRSPSIPFPAAQQIASTSTSSTADNAPGLNSRRTSTSAATSRPISTTPATSVPPAPPHRTSTCAPKVQPPPATAPPSSASTVKPRARPVHKSEPMPVPSREVPSGSASTSRLFASKLSTTAVKTSAAPSQATSKVPLKKVAESYTKHHTHWYLDGSLFVQLGNVRYRLHRSRMVRVSEWFQDALEPTRRKGKEKGKQGDGKVGKVEVEYEEDGTPLVRLDGVGVARKDWEALLDALDGAVTFIYTPPLLSTVASLLRASHLLRVRNFKAYAQRAFEEVWSDDLESVCRGDLRRSGVSATEAIFLGRLCGLPGVVKRGLYELLKSETFEQDDSDSEDAVSESDEESEDEENESDVSVIVIDSDIEVTSTSRVGKKRKDKTTKLNRRMAKKEPKPRWTLSQKDFTLLTKARSKLIARWNRETVQFPESLLPCPDATTNSDSAVKDLYRCEALDAAGAREAHRRLVIQSGVQESYMYDALGGLRALEDLRWGRYLATSEEEKKYEEEEEEEEEEGEEEEEEEEEEVSSSSSERTGKRSSEQTEHGGEHDKRILANGKATARQNADDDGEEVYYGEFCEHCVEKMKRIWTGTRERIWRDCEELFAIKR